MDSKKMIKTFKREVVSFHNVDMQNKEKITKDEVYVVWFSKTLQNAKALLSTTLSDGMYYEATYNGDKNEMYLDAYKKLSNKAIDLSK